VHAQKNEKNEQTWKTGISATTKKSLKMITLSAMMLGTPRSSNNNKRSFFQ
jgi:hypothetical protein